MHFFGTCALYTQHTLQILIASGCNMDSLCNIKRNPPFIIWWYTSWPCLCCVHIFDFDLLPLVPSADSTTTNTFTLAKSMPLLIWFCLSRVWMTMSRQYRGLFSFSSGILAGRHIGKRFFGYQCVSRRSQCMHHCSRYLKCADWQTDAMHRDASAARSNAAVERDATK